MPRTQTELTPYRKAWLTFKATHGFQHTSDPTTLGAEAKQRPYLENRLEEAFAEGWNAKTSLILDAINSSAKQGDLKQP